MFQSQNTFQYTVQYPWSYYDQFLLGFPTSDMSSLTAVPDINNISPLITHSNKNELIRSYPLS